MAHPEPRSGPSRLREIHAIEISDGKVALLYELERTFVIEVPPALREKVAAALASNGCEDLAVRRWLMEEDLITTEPRPSRSEGSSPKMPAISDVSLDMSGA